MDRTTYIKICERKEKLFGFNIFFLVSLRLTETTHHYTTEMAFNKLKFTLLLSKSVQILSWLMTYSYFVYPKSSRRTKAIYKYTHLWSYRCMHGFSKTSVDWLSTRATLLANGSFQLYLWATAHFHNFKNDSNTSYLVIFQLLFWTLLTHDQGRPLDEGPKGLAPGVVGESTLQWISCCMHVTIWKVGIFCSSC